MLCGLSLCHFSFGYCVFYSYSIYGFLLPLCYLQIFLILFFFSISPTWQRLKKLFFTEGHFTDGRKQLNDIKATQRNQCRFLIISVHVTRHNKSWEKKLFRKLVKLNIIRFEILYERDIAIYLPMKRILIPVQKQFKTELIGSCY